MVSERSTWRSGGNRAECLVRPGWNRGSAQSASGSCQSRPPADVIGVAHNAGDSPESIAESIAAGAEVIEIDLRSSEGELVSAHNRLLAIRFFSFVLGMRAEEAIGAASSADGLLLDLKQSDPEYLELVSRLIGIIDPNKIVYLSTPDIAALEQIFAEQAKVIPLLTIRDTDSLAWFLGLETPPESVAGVSIRYKLLDSQVIEQLCRRNLVIFAWPVDDPMDALNLIASGVDGITTGNPEILAALRTRTPDPESVP